MIRECREEVLLGMIKVLIALVARTWTTVAVPSPWPDERGVVVE